MNNLPWNIVRLGHKVSMYRSGRVLIRRPSYKYVINNKQKIKYAKKSFPLSGVKMSSLIADLLRQSGGTAVIDGGLATELERHGADLNDPLWSAKCLFSSPHLIRQVHSPSFQF